MMRAAVLVNERDVRLGSVMVPESTFVIKHGGAFFFRTDKALRLAGGGIGAVFLQVEPLVRERLDAR